MDPDRMKELTDTMNYRHTLAQHSGRDSRNLFTGFFFDSFRDGKKIEDQDAYVVRVLDNGVVMMILKWGVEGTVYFDDCPQFKGKLNLLDKMRVSVALKEGMHGDASRNKMLYTIMERIPVKRRVSAIVAEEVATSADKDVGGARVAGDGPATTVKVDNVVFGGAGDKRKGTVTKTVKRRRVVIDERQDGGLKKWETVAPQPRMAPAAPAAKPAASPAAAAVPRRKKKRPAAAAAERRPVPPLIIEAEDAESVEL